MPKPTTPAYTISTQPNEYTITTLANGLTRTQLRLNGPPVPDRSAEAARQVIHRARGNLTGSKAKAAAAKLAETVEGLERQLADVEAAGRPHAAAAEMAQALSGLTRTTDTLRQRVEQATATLSVGQVVQKAVAEIQSLQAEAERIKARLPEVIAFQADPSTLDRADAGAALVQAEGELADLQRREREIRAALGVAHRHLSTRSEEWQAEAGAVCRQAANELMAEAVARRDEILKRLAVAMAPVLTELWDAEAVLTALSNGSAWTTAAAELAGSVGTTPAAAAA